MPEIEFPILAGVIKDETPLKAEGFCQDTKGARIRNKSWETQKGRQKATGTAFTGIVRGGFAWADSSNVKVALFGTQDYLYSFYGGAIADITPLKAKGTLVSAFTTENGSSTVEVYDSTHGLNEDDVVTYSNADAVGGLTIDGAYTIESVLDINRYTIDAGSNASSTATGGGKVEFSVPLEAGRLHGVAGFGYGSGTYSSGTYGRAVASIRNLASIWTGGSFGTNGITCRKYGPIYEFQPRPDYTIEHVTNGTFDTDTDWTKGTGFTIGSGVATASAGTESRLEQDGTGTLSGGVAYEVTFVITRTAGAVEFFVDSDPTGASPTEYILGESIEKSATYTRRFKAPPSPTDFGFKKDASFAGTIDTVSIKLISEAYRIDSAPPVSAGVTVDNNNCIICWDTIGQNGVYNPKAVRWTPPGDSATWLSSSSNLAGENSDFGAATRVMAVLPANNSNIVFTNSGLSLMQFTGNTGDAFQFDAINGGAGLASPQACAADEGRVFWFASNNRFYIYQGGFSAQLLDCPFIREIEDNLNAANVDKISCKVNSKYSEITWLIPDTRDGKEISRSYTFNWVENAWYNDEQSHTFYIKSGVYNNEIGFGNDNYVYFTDLGKSDNGNPLTTRILTGEYDTGDGHNLTYLRRFIPDFDDQVGSVELTIHYRMEARGAALSKGPFTISPTTNKVDFRINAKRFWLEFTSSNIDTFYRFGSFRMDIQPIPAIR